MYDRRAQELIEGRAPHTVGGESDEIAPAPLDMRALVGKRVAHYRILAPIAAGGMGVVYRAEHLLLGREVALKLPLPALIADPSNRARLIREARIAGRLQHENICQILEVGETDDGHVYLAMPLYAGETLRERLDRSPRLTVPEIIAIGRQIARGLEAAHAAGVMHRDLKPANVMLDATGHVRLLDFGLARTVDATQSQRAGTMGTVAYMAPERVRGNSADARADVWSLGVILYEMLTGVRPFEGDHPVAIAQAILHQAPVPIERVRREAPWPLRVLVMDCLAKSADDRPSRASDTEHALAAVAAGGDLPWWERVRWAAERVARSHRAVRTAIVGTGVVAIMVLAARPTRHPTSGRESSDPQANLLMRRAAEYDRETLNVPNLTLALRLYEGAIARDSTLALAYARWALARARLAGLQGVSDSVTHAVETAARHALRLSPNLPEAHLALGALPNVPPEQVIPELQLAAEGMPRSIEPFSQLAIAYRMQNRMTEAIAQYQRALAIEPSNVEILRALAATYLRTRRYAASESTRTLVAALDPENVERRLSRALLFTRWLGNPDTLDALLRSLPDSLQDDRDVMIHRVLLSWYQRRPSDALRRIERSRHALLSDGLVYWPRDLLRGRLYAAMGEAERARASYRAAARALEDSLRRRPEAWSVRAALGEAYAGAGSIDSARNVAGDLLGRAENMNSYNFASISMLGAAEIYSRLGDADHAIPLVDALLRRNAGREMSVPLLRLDPTWDPLRHDPRFRALVDGGAAAGQGRP